MQEAAPAPAAPKQRQVGIADQIAIRSYVLGKGLKSSEYTKDLKLLKNIIQLYKKYILSNGL